MKTGAIIQARTSSRRLPKKILLELPYGSKVTVLEQVIRRTKKAKTLDSIVVATTDHAEDDIIVEIAEKEKVPWFRGSKEDVLSRYYHCAREYGLDIVVRITSDCPCLDPEIVDRTLKEHIDSSADYTSHRGFPLGMGVEVVNFDVLEEAYRKAKKDFEREHVTPYIHTTEPNSFRIHLWNAPEELRREDIRVTLDTEEDYALLCAVFDYLYPKDELFGLKEIVALYDEKPWLALINRKVMQKRTYLSLQEELRDAVRLLELQELPNAKEIILRELKKIQNFRN